MSYLERVLDDGSDRDRWLAARRPVIGASDAAKLSKLESVPLYLAAKLSDGGFHGNEYTEAGHRWEPMMLAWAGIPENKALIHSPLERGFAATPDGIGNTLAECKAKTGKVIFGPSLGELRQASWQLATIPEVDELEWIWVELIDGDIRSGCNGEPKSLTIRRSDNKVNDLLKKILPIATDLLARLTAALAFEREMNAA